MQVEIAGKVLNTECYNGGGVTVHYDCVASRRTRLLLLPIRRNRIENNEEHLSLTLI